jgi:YD repeat-containing protein
MATRKKKADVIMSADIAEMTGPKVVKGNHLTVTTHPDGRTELVWDDNALLAEVRTALESAELAAMKPAVRAKVATRKKKEKQNGN